MAADLLRANVSLEAERDRARDDVEQLSTELKDTRADLDAWQTKYRQAQQELEDARKRHGSLELDYNKLSSKCEVNRYFWSLWLSYIMVAKRAWPSVQLQYYTHLYFTINGSTKLKGTKTLHLHRLKR